MSVQFHGVTASDDLKPGLIKKDTRTTMESFRDATYNSSGEIQMAMGGLIIIMPFFGFVVLAEFLFLMALAYSFYSKNKIKEYTFHKPVQLDDNGNKIKGNKGILLIANDKEDKTCYWFSDDDLRTHMLVFGTTGSGKTRFLLGVLYQSMMFASGCMYVDGKGDNTVWWLVFSFCRKVNKVDDLLVLNYLTGEEDTTVGGKPSLKRKSNTSNPFAHGSSEQLRSLVVGLMRDGGGDDMWKGRASSMLGSLLKVLCELRNIGEINLDIDTIRDYMPLDRIIELSQAENKLSESSINSIKKYLADLPGYKEDDAIVGEVEQKAYEQHGYLTMQLTEVMADLAETYGHIFSAQLGEIDYKDVVFNRRILFVILPSLEKDPDALAGLGKLVVAGVRSALAPALGDELEGLKINVIDKKPTKCDVPFIMILDEYGYYAVKGFAVVAAQARSLGVSVVFAGQDYQSLKKASEEEAAATVANTNIKVCMKLEDPKETLDIMKQRAGQAYLAKLPGHENSEATVGALYKQMRNTQIELVDRMNLRDLVAQAPGAAHVMNADKLGRCQLYFADPHEVDEAKLNKFLQIKKPKKEVITKFRHVTKTLDELWAMDVSEIDNSDMTMDDNIKKIILDFEISDSHKATCDDSARFSIGLNELREREKDAIMDAKSLEDNMSEAELRAKSKREAVANAKAKAKEERELVTADAPMPSKDAEAAKFSTSQQKAQNERVSALKDLVSKHEVIEELESPQEAAPGSKEAIEKAKSIAKSVPPFDPMEDDYDTNEIEKEKREGVAAVVSDEHKPDNSLADQADEYTARFMDTFDDGITKSNIDRSEQLGQTLSHEDKVNMSPKGQISALELMKSRGNEEEAERDAKQAGDIISQQLLDISEYGNDPIPEKLGQAEIMGNLKFILEKINA